MSGHQHLAVVRSALCALVLCLASRSAFAVQATLIADAHVSSAQPDVNSGTLTNLNVGGGYTALVQFDLGILPSGTTAAQARLIDEYLGQSADGVRDWSVCTECGMGRVEREDVPRLLDLHREIVAGQA